MKGMDGDIHIHPELEEVYRDSAERIALLATRSIAEHGSFHFALAGGATPAGTYKVLGTPPLRDEVDWSRVHVYFGDERCVPPDHRDSNFRMAQKTLLSRVPLPESQQHRIRGELEPEAAVRHYTETLRRELPLEGTIPVFDLVMLGTGPDGHIASLFPGTDILKRRKPVAAVYVPKLGAWRISLTFPVLNAARHVIVLVTGPKKADVIRHVVKHHDSNPLPLELLRPRGQLEWFLDRAAARYIIPI
ncbi:6-phosphogluconolactonase [Thiohalomonas denitrificans]|uniref:6-phosphogluconolactonase n=1 Tax=Thiohalomonas denitrificans TaxID=415747 RepID=A0A1G5QA03_9GAMM|nr:6-phosphogluconolactonase [Thiohalomonas denitrificans]SCZ58406.1 6-phosphogluconolactonase [Thiohalomonas denitrificans]